MKLLSKGIRLVIYVVYIRQVNLYIVSVDV